MLVLPILAGGLLLWPRALRILFGLVAPGAACTTGFMGKAPGPGIVATIVVTALFAYVLARTREKLGILGLRGDQMLIELRDRIRVQGRIPALPEGWHSVSVLQAAGGSSFGGDFLVSACDGKELEVALVDVAGKGIDAGTRALLLSGAFGGLLGSVPPGEFLSACQRLPAPHQPGRGLRHRRARRRGPGHRRVHRLLGRAPAGRALRGGQRPVAADRRPRHRPRAWCRTCAAST